MLLLHVAALRRLVIAALMTSSMAQNLGLFRRSLFHLLLLCVMKCAAFVCCCLSSLVPSCYTRETFRYGPDVASFRMQHQVSNDAPTLR